jgi:hypothetical protein
MDRVAYPSGVREYVVGPRVAAIHKFVTHRSWKRQIRKPVTVKMAELYPAHSELDAAEAMRRRTNPGPSEYLLDDAVVNRGHFDPPTAEPGGGFPVAGAKRSNLLDISRT